jgi:hypothetical protein
MPLLSGWKQSHHGPSTLSLETKAASFQKLVALVGISWCKSFYPSKRFGNQPKPKKNGPVVPVIHGTKHSHSQDSNGVETTMSIVSRFVTGKKFLMVYRNDHLHVGNRQNAEMRLRGNQLV